ncbi:MAG: formylglycine-generating enzyme family protein [Planctomycetaceae bacterium]
MTKRIFAFTGVAFVAGVLLSSNLPIQAIHGQALQTPNRPDARFQMATLNGDSRAYVVVFDPSSGECWVQDTAFQGWRYLGSPVGNQPAEPERTPDRGFEGTNAGDRKELVPTPTIAFRWCPAGAFTMGEDDKKVEVALTSGYWLGETEITQGQWQKLMGTSPWSGKELVKEGEDYAATYISHHDAVSYCQKLTVQERSAGRLPKGWKYCLPTEAKWEYACRAGAQSQFSFGQSERPLDEYGWFEKNAAEMGENFAHRVGMKKPNAWGVLDMHGNVGEWCSDWWDKKLFGSRDPVGLSTGAGRVHRGGAWTSLDVNCRSAARRDSSPDFRSYDLGFRLSCLREN